MTPSGQTLCLCMIVKDEAHVIRRCLASVKPIIDHWIIVDTGSTDGTQDVIRDAMAGLPGEVVERPWVDFAHNRSEALALARPHGTYSLIIDADDTLDIPADFRLPDLGDDSYIVDIRDTAVVYQRTQFVSNRLPWRYRGVLHEFLTCEEARSTGRLPIAMRRNHDGARRRDSSTYVKDAAILERALQAETDPFLVARYTFYLAQSYRDCGQAEKAAVAYLGRASLGFWDQEIFVSLLQAGRLLEGLKRDADEVLAIYRRATEACPSRAEAVHAASRLCRGLKRFKQGYEAAEPAIDLTAPSDGLFVETWIYDYGLLDEYAVNAYWTGLYQESADACRRILARPDVPDDNRKRIEANLKFALDKLAVPAGGQMAPKRWVPATPQGGTELMVDGLRQRLGGALDPVDLQINAYDPARRDARPLVVWCHHDIDQAAVQWCRDAALVERVACFVFVSHWQRERYVATFNLPSERCVVIRNAVEPAARRRHWDPAPVLRCAYASTPFRGLDVLLDAWERLPEGRAELHIWSSMKLYKHDDAPYQRLFDRAREMQGVTYHGLAPNAELRAALRTMHFLTYPSTFAETACLAVMEAMEAGCRVIVPAFGALPETTSGYAHVYPWCADKARHAALFSAAVVQEFADPWHGRPQDALMQQAHCAATFGWEKRLGEWRRLIASLGASATERITPRSVVSESRRLPEDAPMRRALLRLKDLGFAPAGLLDIGAHDGGFARAAREVFPSTEIMMIEALAEKGPVLEKVAQELGNAAHLIAMLGEQDSNAAAFFVVDTAARPDLVKTGSSAFRENSPFPMIERSVAQRRLDEVMAEHSTPIPFIKLDVQGGELAILRGLGKRRDDVEVILTEMSLVAYNAKAPLLAEVIAQLLDWGFVLFDLVEEHRYWDGRLLQVDGLFVRENSLLRPKPPFWV